MYTQNMDNVMDDKTKFLKRYDIEEVFVVELERMVSIGISKK
jgi:hypothetical protein